ncbi:hypothetical protein [Vulcanisaeta thermophila]|uniref:hypothetical protein n=1 Tax=Vulcanisaeta thermophila TaxID=867917 RepID=UPI00138A33FA|nr:hypothetical protein [Vulcanisaeta thermophila]
MITRVGVYVTSEYLLLWPRVIVRVRDHVFTVVNYVTPRLPITLSRPRHSMLSTMAG